MPNREEEFAERRKHKRLEVKNGVSAALIEPQSGNDYIYTGKILNISQGGLAFQYVCRNDNSKESFALDILVFKDILRFLFLKKIPFRTAWIRDMATASVSGKLTTKRSGLEFSDLTPDQVSVLDIFLQKYAIKCV